MEFKVYELMLLFAIYSVAGWVVEQLLYGITGNVSKRGFLRMPAGLTYGICALIIIIVLGPYINNYLYVVCGSLMICVVVQLIAIIGIKLVSGVLLWNYFFIFPILGSIFSLVIIEDITPLLIKFIGIVPMWIHFVFLLFFYGFAVVEFIDSVDLLRRYRKGMKILKSMEVDNLEYGQLSCEFLEAFHRWIKAYPEFKKRTLKKIFKGFSCEEIVVIKNAMKNHLQE